MNHEFGSKVNKCEDSKGGLTKAAALELLEIAECGKRIVICKEKGMIRHRILHTGHIKRDHHDTVQMTSLGRVWLGLMKSIVIVQPP